MAPYIAPNPKALNKKPTATKGKINTSPKPVVYNPNDPFASAIANYDLQVDTDTGIITGAGSGDGSRPEYFIYIPEGGKTAQIESDWAVLKKKIIIDYQSSGRMDALFSLLHSKNLINDATFKMKDVSSADFAKGLRASITYSGVQTLYNRELGGSKTAASTLFEFLPTIPNKESRAPEVTRYITTRPDSDEEVDRFFIENVGRKASMAEKENYYKTLHTAESKAARTTVKGTTTGSLIDEADRTVMLSRIAGNAIAGSDVNVLLKSGAGAAQGINDLKAYASKYGIILSDMQALNYVVDALKSGKDMKSKKAKILKLSQIKYNNLADSLDDDTSVEDIASETIYAISQLTGLPYNSLSVNHPIVQKALANNGKPGVMAKHEVEYLVRNSPETRQAWLASPGAREEAAGYANSILKSFGVIG